MKLQIEASPKELAALVLELQERHACGQLKVTVTDDLIKDLQQRLGQCQEEFSL